MAGLQRRVEAKLKEVSESEEQEAQTITQSDLPLESVSLNSSSNIRSVAPPKVLMKQRLRTAGRI